MAKGLRGWELEPGRQGVSGENPVTVGISLYILSISDFSEKSMDFTLNMYFRQFWHDYRLAFEQRVNLNKIVQYAEYMKNIWVPDTFFPTEKSSHYHKATVDNQFLRIMYSGNILRSERLTVKASCPLDLQYFPLDKQLCHFNIESFGHTTEDIRYRWEDGENSVQISPDVSLPEFSVLGHTHRAIESSLSTGNYSRLEFQILFSRNIGPYIVQVFIPLAMLVMMSMVTLYLGQGEITARLLVCMICILASTIIMVFTQQGVPRIAYYTAMDTYTGACLITISTIIVHTVCLAYLSQLQHQPDCNTSQDEVPQFPSWLKPNYLDIFGRIAFPVAFLVFNIGYWINLVGNFLINNVDDLTLL